MVDHVKLVRRFMVNNSMSTYITMAIPGWHHQRGWGRFELTLSLLEVAVITVVLFHRSASIRPLVATRVCIAYDCFQYNWTLVMAS